MTPFARGLAVALAAGLLAAPARADQLVGFLELTAAEAVSRQESDGVPVSRTESDFVNRRLYFAFSRDPYPWLRVWGGGTFEDTDSAFDADATRSDTDRTRIRPYLGVGRRTARWLTQLSWNRDDGRSKSNGESLPRTIRDAFNVTVGFSPAEPERPRARFYVSRTLDRDAARLRRDLVSDQADLEVSQRVRDEVRWSYRGTFADRDDRRSGSSATSTNHRAELAYNDTWFDRRLSFGADYAISLRESKLRSTGGADVDVPIFPFEGLFARGDTPLDTALAPLPALIDDDVETPTAIDLGLPPAGGDERPWEIGLDLGRPIGTSLLLVWIDRDIPPAIAGTFSWQLYTSLDNVLWTPGEGIGSAPYDEFQRRFEIRFASVQFRYLKLAVRPLGPLVPGASQYPDIFVTEIDAAERVTPTSARADSSDTFQTLNFDTRARLIDGREFYYYANGNATDSRGSRPDYRFSNGLSYLHHLADEADLSSRVSWELSRDERRSDRALSYGASLRAAPVERLQYTLSLSGRREKIADATGGDQISLFLYATAALYDGVDLQLGAGRSYREDIEGRTVPSTQIDFLARLEPRSDLILQLIYTDTLSEPPAGSPVRRDLFSRAAETNVNYAPVPTLYLYGSYRLEWRTGEERDTLRRVIFGWTPFPRSILRLALNYDERRREQLDEIERFYGPSLRWTINSRSWLETTWFNSLDQTGALRFENEILSAILRWGF